MRFVLAAFSRSFAILPALVAVTLCAPLAVKGMLVDIFPQVDDPVMNHSEGGTCASY
jgi:hypothetical protein